MSNTISATTTTDVQVFNNPLFGDVRVIEIDDEPWFVGKDVAAALGYSNPSKAVMVHVDEEDKQFLMLDIADSQNGNLLTGQSKTTIINESGLYSLILSSKLPTAKEFKRWVTSEVLPSIRKHGAYMTPEVLYNALVNPDTIIAICQQLKAEQDKNKALEADNAVKAQQLLELQPKASYYDVVLACKDLIPITVIAKDYGLTANWLNRYLEEKGVQFKQSGIWILKKKYAERGYTGTQTHTIRDNDEVHHVKVHTYWTQKGRLFIYELLKADGILPIVEREDATLCSVDSCEDDAESEEIVWKKN